MAAKKKSNIIQTTGKRKTSVARASLKPGNGLIKINSVPLKEYGNSLARARVNEPILLSGEVAKKVDINLRVRGGGWQGQASAIRLAIARCLVLVDEKLKKVFLAYDRNLLVADIRVKEKCKPNKSKARAKRQKSYR